MAPRRLTARGLPSYSWFVSGRIFDCCRRIRWPVHGRRLALTKIDVTMKLFVEVVESRTRNRPGWLPDRQPLRQYEVIHLVSLVEPVEHV